MIGYNASLLQHREPYRGIFVVVLVGQDVDEAGAPCAAHQVGVTLLLEAVDHRAAHLHLGLQLPGYGGLEWDIDDDKNDNDNDGGLVRNKSAIMCLNSCWCLFVRACILLLHSTEELPCFFS